jgi:hypothetical protein
MLEGLLDLILVDILNQKAEEWAKRCHELLNLNVGA